MSTIFISHSSADRSQAEEIASVLTKSGYDSLFLDVDPKKGIFPGDNWERRLFDSLNRCLVVIAVLSRNWMKSSWCKVEVTHARFFEKPVIPVKIDRCICARARKTEHTCDLGGVGDTQYVDLLAGKEVAYGSLLSGLEKVVEDPELIHWDSRKSPYPGLLAFQESQTAIFFGRTKETKSFFERLRNLVRYRSQRLALIVGTSGAGKSSLLRAGLLPRLRRERNLVVVGPFLPGGDPFLSLALALSAAFRGFEKERSAAALQHLLETQGKRGLRESLLDLLSAGQRSEAAILLVIDQFEELLGEEEEHPSSKFLGILRRTLEDPACGSLLALGTLRSDFYQEFQKDPALLGLDHQTLSLGPIPRSRLAEVIEGPARRVRLDLKPGVVQRLVEDTSADDALPLLAFTLERLYEEYGRKDNDITLEEYELLGGLEGSVEHVVDQVTRDLLGGRPWSSEEQLALKTVFTRMARLGGGGSFVRSRIPWPKPGTLPGLVEKLLEAFVERRLLVAGGADQDAGSDCASEPGFRSTLEVAHEALFRRWKLLRGWLEEDREFFDWQVQLKAAFAGWQESHDPGQLLRGSALKKAERWRRERPDALEQEQSLYVELSLALQQALDDAAAWRRLKDKTGEVWDQPAEYADKVEWSSEFRAILSRVSQHESTLEQIARSRSGRESLRSPNDDSGELSDRDVAQVQILCKELQGTAKGDVTMPALAIAMRFVDEEGKEEKHPWDSSRPPYPGLLSYMEEDAAAFFGRKRESEAFVNELLKLAAQRVTRLALIVGSSGVGKTSLLQAGMLPRLRYLGNFILVGPIGQDRYPLKSFAAALGHVFRQWGAKRADDEILHGYEHADDPEGWLRGLAENLRAIAGQSAATVVLLIDHFENVLSEESRPFQRILRTCLGMLQTPYLVVGAIDARWYGSFLLDPMLGNLGHIVLPLGPPSPEAVQEIIQEPLRLAGMDLEPRLANRLLGDVGNVEGPLPLLSYAMRELWEAREDRTLTLARYEETGVALAANVDHALEAAAGTQDEGEQVVRDSLLRLVRMTEEGEFVPRVASWEEFPAEGQKVLELLVGQRLLVATSGELRLRTIQLAHGIVLRVSRRLQSWCEEMREALQLSHEIERAAEAWNRGGSQEREEYLWQGARLARAREMLWAGMLQLGELGRGFIEASEAVEARRQAETKRRKASMLRQQRSVRRSLLVGMLAGGLLWFGIQTIMKLLIN